MATNPDNSEIETKLADSVEILGNVEYLWSCTEPISIEQARYLKVLRSETKKLEAILQDYRRAA